MPFEFAVVVVVFVVEVDGIVWMVLSAVVVTEKDETLEEKVVNNDNRKNKIMLLLHLLFKSIEVEVKVKVAVMINGCSTQKLLLEFIIKLLILDRMSLMSIFCFCLSLLYEQGTVR